MSRLEFAGLEAWRRTFTVLFHDLGKSSAVWSGRRGLIEVTNIPAIYPTRQAAYLTGAGVK
jgi:hypothetical protein